MKRELYISGVSGKRTKRKTVKRKKRITVREALKEQNIFIGNTKNEMHKKFDEALIKANTKKKGN